MSDTNMNIENVTNEQLSGVITAQRGHVQALAFARKGGDGLSSVLHNVWVAKAAERKGSLNVLVYLLNHYADDELAAIPEPGSKKGETGNKPYDKYSVKTKTKDGDKTVPGSWYTDTVRATDEWEYCNNVIAWCNGDADAALSPEDEAKYGKFGTIAKRQLKEDMQDAIRDMRTALVKGCQLYLHCETINAINPDRIKVKLPTITVKDDNNQPTLMVGGSGSIRVQDPTDEFEDEIYSVSEFIALDPAKLEGTKDKQTIKTLAATKARAPRGSGSKTKGKGKEDIAVPTTVDGLINLFNVAATAIDNATDEGQKLEAALIARFNSKGDNKIEAIKSVGALAFAIDNLWTLVKGEYTKIQSDERRAADTKVEQERKAASAH